MNIYILIIGILFILLGVFLKFRPQYIITIPKQYMCRVNKKKLSRFLFISYCTVGIILIVMQFISTLSTGTYFSLILNGLTFPAIISCRYIGKKDD